jgi:hypothetical protein
MADISGRQTDDRSYEAHERDSGEPLPVKDDEAQCTLILSEPD